MGSMGDLIGDMDDLTLTDFRTRKSVKFKPQFEDVERYKNAGHGGGDWLMVRDFVQVYQRKPELLTSSIEDSLESHLMAFMAEKSRKAGKVVVIKL